MMPHKQKNNRQQFHPEMDDTKTHIMAAGRELLLAAHGALKFCKGYVEATMPKQSGSDLVAFFQKAIGVAEELGKGISVIPSMKQAADKFARPLLNTISREMRHPCCPGHESKKYRPGKKASKKRR